MEATTNETLDERIRLYLEEKARQEGQEAATWLRLSGTSVTISRTAPS